MDQFTMDKSVDNLQSSKQFIGMKFDCCHIYNRIYINKEKTAYEGRCPKCLRKISIKISKGGVSDRFFSAQ